jgi:hypothetical protein
MLLCKHVSKSYYDITTTKNIVNLDEVIPIMWETQNPLNLTQETMSLHNLLSLFHLLRRRTKAKVSRAQKQPSPQDFLTIMKIKVGLVLNSNCETKKTKTQHVQNKNPTKFYWKEETKIEQGYDKKMYPKLVL